MEIEFGLAHHGMDGSAPVEDRSSPVVEIDSEGGCQFLERTDHLSELSCKKPLHPFVSLIGFVPHIVVKGAQKVIPD